MNEKKRTHILFLILINLALFITSLFLTPIGDDWGYSTTPLINKAFTMTSRPFDFLFGLLLGKFPSAFPFLNHLVVVIGHCISSIIMYQISTDILKIKNKCSFLFSVLFSISSTCYATVFSIDSLNQSLSLCFGVVGIYAYTHLSKNAVIKTVIYLVSSILASFSKECGIVFFLIIPLFEVLIKGIKPIWKRTLINYALGGIFCIFFLKIVSASKNISTFSLIRIFKNTVFHLGFSALQFDTVSFFGHGKFIIPILTVVLSLPLLFLIAKTIIQKLRRKDITILFLCFLTLLSTFPQNTMSGIQEMNSYPTVFFIMLFFAYLCKDLDKKSIYYAVAPYLVSALICGGIKYAALYKLSLQSQEVLNNIAVQTKHLSPEKVKAYPINVFNEDSYGVFVLSPSGTIGYGHALKSIYGYDKQVDLEYYHNKTDKTVIGSTDSVLINMPDEEFYKTLNEIARDDIKNNGYDLCLIIEPNGSIYIIN